ncbi:hypothetical protein PHYSODRAFT_495537 [Phytophthora sojae]|uniref:Uncharacterized protein n=1 Tax=Phytophthora sojae (strain P6497) TaxID=1094619 RepID=G4Z7Z3_PHYSP|nr:hypothetical protein PHYSODRAFT_495537 [Phytophthora sojae]EGZ22528.1 hypothetical protein PHYSODRAFT_495537 [Phytophthora sojae]|eukprot:XP_009525245.1 hypothetical protein PHYSODRAFT_495537 [Phytophthora sojae]
MPPLRCELLTTACWVPRQPKPPLVVTCSSTAHATDWEEQYQRKVEQVTKNNKRENDKRRNWTYAPGDKVLLRNDAGPQAKMAPLFSGPPPPNVVAVRTNGTN